MRILFYFITLCSFLFAEIEHEGIVYSKEEVKLSLPLDGVVSIIYSKDGTIVKKDASILKLDDKLQKLEVQRRKEIFRDKSEYSANKANLKITKEVLDSSLRLYKKSSSVSKDELSNLKIQYQNLRGKVLAYKSKKKQEEVEYKIAKEVLNKYTLKSPINGVVTNLKYDVGEWAKVGEVAVIVVDIDNCYVELNINEPIARNLKLNAKAMISANNTLIQKEAYVSYIAPLAESTSALVKVKVMFENSEPKITPGVIAKVIFDVNTGESIAK